MDVAIHWRYAIAGIARYGHKIRDYFAVSFSLGSAIFATTLLPLGLSGGEIHSQIPWISTLGLEAGVLQTLYLSL